MSTDGTTINTRVTGAAREKCWEARDLYFVCLDQYEDDESKCAKPKETFEETCPTAWVHQSHAVSNCRRATAA